MPKQYDGLYTEMLVATLMRSQDSGAEFSDMAGKSLTVEWLVENAPSIFNYSSNLSN